MLFASGACAPDAKADDDVGVHQRSSEISCGSGACYGWEVLGTFEADAGISCGMSYLHNSTVTGSAVLCIVTHMQMPVMTPVNLPELDAVGAVARALENPRSKLLPRLRVLLKTSTVIAMEIFANTSANRNCSPLNQAH